MKQKLYTLGLVVALIVFTGAIFKVNHWPGAGILLTLGILSLVLIFLPAALVNHYKSRESEKHLSLYIITWITCFVLFGSMLFKIMHWPYAGLLLLIALPFPYLIFLPVFLSVTSKNRNFNIYNTVYVLLLLALNSVFSGLLALNPSMIRIHDSYNISSDYNKSKELLTSSKPGIQTTPVSLKIDEVIGVIDKTQAALLKYREIDVSGWVSNAKGLSHPEERIGQEMTISDAEKYPGMMLAVGLRELTGVIDKTPGYEKLAQNIGSITDFRIQPGEEEIWAKSVFSNNNLAWALIYLDGLRTNLLMIKQAVPAGYISNT
ncbi:MAG TPA: hypothetical protein VJ963_04345 [Bacteroidales bacterium]|nr:hypothetical protein [Bacteroidales bacterium]